MYYTVRPSYHVKHGASGRLISESASSEILDLATVDVLTSNYDETIVTHGLSIAKLCTCPN